MPTGEGVSAPGRGQLQRPASACVVGRWPTRDHSRHTGLLHEIPDRQALTDRLSRMLVAPGIEHRDAFGHQQRGQRHILSDHQVPSDSMAGDVLVGDVGTAVHPHGAHQGITRWCLEPLIRDQHGFDRQPFGRSKHQLLHLSWCRIRIDPDLQGRSGLGLTAQRNADRPRAIAPEAAAKARNQLTAPWRDMPTSGPVCGRSRCRTRRCRDSRPVHFPDGRRIAQKASFTPAQGTKETKRARPGLEPVSPPGTRPRCTNTRS